MSADVLVAVFLLGVTVAWTGWDLHLHLRGDRA